MGAAGYFPNDFAGSDEAPVPFADDQVADQGTPLAGRAGGVAVGGSDGFKPKALEDARCLKLVRRDVPITGGDDASVAVVRRFGDAAYVIETALAVYVRKGNRLRSPL